jgi:hypothetical protein
MYGMGARVLLLQDQQNLILIQIVFSIATDGYYTMNTETLKYTLVAYDAAAAATIQR